MEGLLWYLETKREKKEDIQDLGTPKIEAGDWQLQDTFKGKLSLSLT